MWEVDKQALNEKQHLTTSKAVPQCPIDDAPSSVKGGSAPLCVVVRHGGVGICIGARQLLEDLRIGKLLISSHLKLCVCVSGFVFLPAHLEWERTSSPPVGAEKSQRDRRPPVPLRGGWQTEQTAVTWSTSSLHRSLVPPVVQKQNWIVLGSCLKHLYIEQIKTNAPWPFQTSRHLELGCGQCGRTCFGGSGKRWRWDLESCDSSRCSERSSFHWSNRLASGPEMCTVKQLGEWDSVMSCL